MNNIYRSIKWSVIAIMLSINSLMASEADNHSQDAPNVVSGIVLDSNNIPAVGVVVNVQGQNNWDTTNIDGEYKVTVKSPSNDILEFSFIGLETQVVSVNNRTHIDVQMQDDAVMINEVVAIGYGTARKSDLTGAVSSVKGEDLTASSSSDVLLGLQGKMAGVNITPNSGAPGESVNIKIRGIGTINNSNPIYVVDGFQISDINYLSVNDIQSIEVLKDASATAIYGSRGANGVVLVTTKKSGKAGVNVSANYSYGIQSANKEVDMLNAWQFATLYREAYSNAGATLSSADNAITKYVIDNKLEGTNWQDLIFRENTPVHNADISISGSNERNSYLGSVSYIDNTGLVKHNSYDKLTARLYNSYHLTDNIIWDVDMSYSHSDKQDVPGGVLTSALYMDPISIAWNTNTNNYGENLFNAIEASNPYMTVDLSKNNNLTKNERLVANTSLSIKDIFVKGLSFSTKFGYDKQNINKSWYWPEYKVNETTYNTESSLTKQVSQWTSWMWSNVLNYDKQIANHSFGAMAGFEMQKFEDLWISGTAYDIPNNVNQMYFDLAGNQEKKNLSGNYSESALMSYFARLNYKFMDRYMLTATVRADGSSKFVGDNRWGIFPSVAAAWDLKKENFLKRVEPISALKINAGWGVVGNQNSLSSPYVYASTVTTESNNYVLNGQINSGYYPAKLSNKEIRWETTETYNVGLDLSLFSNIVTLSANAFQNTTRDMIATPVAPVYVGYSAVPANIGSMRNKGLEFAVGYQQRFNDFYVGVDWNLTTFQNEVLSLGTSTAITSGNLPRLDPTTYTDVGSEMGAFHGLATYGVFTQESLSELHAKYPDYQPNAKPGDLWFVDYDGDHQIDKTSDRQYLGSAIPDFTSGLNINLSYKNFELSCSMIGSYGNEIVNGQYVYVNGSNIKSNWSARMWDRSTDGKITDVPRLDLADVNGNTSTFSDMFVEDGSYLRMKNVRFSYTLPRNIVSKLYLSNVKLYVSAENLFTLTNYSGWDPEPVAFGSLSGGVDYGTYPLSRVFTMGININL